MKLWTVYDGDTTYVVGALSAVDAMMVLDEAWGEGTFDEYLKEPGVYVKNIPQHTAENMSFFDEDEDDESTIWAEWIRDKQRRILGSGDY